ncbi:hypothetical protein PTTG_30835, partial [Puccinia triticina 1-1 BBBD Race 1]
NISDFLTKPVGRSKILRAISTVTNSALLTSAPSIAAGSKAACQSSPDDAEALVTSDNDVRTATSYYPGFNQDVSMRHEPLDGTGPF